jgi:hypothetical protein
LFNSSFQCDSICNPGFVHDYSGKTFSRCHKNPRKERYQWYPKKGFSNCIPELASTCDVVPDSEDLTFFLLNNEISQGSDGYSDDEPAEPLAMFSGTIPISPLLDPSTKWTMFINFGHNDPNVDISGVDFTSVNAVVVYQDMKHLILRHREYNGDISLVSKIDLQGRSEDPTEAHKLANLKHSPVLLFRDYYWNPECVTFNAPYETYCDFLSEEVERVCDPWIPTQECLTAVDLRDSICGPIITLPPPTGEGSGEEGSGASGN